MTVRIIAAKEPEPLQYKDPGLCVNPMAGYFKNSLAALLALSAPEPLPFFLPPDDFFPSLFLEELPVACFTTFLASFSSPAIDRITLLS